jgi:hypothetical protein
MQRDISEAYVLPGKINSISVEEVPKLTAISKLERSGPASVGIKTPYASGNGLADL